MRPLLPILLAVPFLTGCVAWEIRDEMRIATYQLEDVKCSLEKVQAQLRDVKSTVDTANAGLDRADERLKQLNTTLASVDTDLDRLDRTNESLVATKETLVTIKGSIARVDEHLGSLRRTISRLDNAIPFFDFGDESPVESAPQPQASAAAPDAPAATADAPVAAQPADGTAPASQSATAGASTPPAPSAPDQTSARRDPLIGTWISQFPKPQSHALVLLADSTALFVINYENGGAELPATWSRSGNTLTVTCPPQQIAGRPDAQAEAKPLVMTYTIIAQTTRTLTLEERSQVVVFAKP